MSNYKIYHTNLILLYHFDALSIDLKSIIHRSTLSNWKRKDISRIIGCDSLSVNDVSVLKEIAKCKKLLRAAKALYFLFHTITSLFKHANNKDELLRLHKTVILNTIEKKKYQNSIFQLCQPRHPNQLLPTEVDIVKNYLLDERFKNWSSLSI